MNFRHTQLNDPTMQVAAKVNDEEIVFSNKLMQELEKRGFFSLRLDHAPGKPYFKVYATFICDKAGVIEVNEFFSLNSSENSIGNKLLRYRDFYFKCREKWENLHGDDSRSESEEESSQGA